MRFTIYRTGAMLAGWELTWDPSNKCLVLMLASGCSFTPSIFQTRSCNQSIHLQTFIYFAESDRKCELLILCLSLFDKLEFIVGMSVWKCDCNSSFFFLNRFYYAVPIGVLNFKWPWFLLETHRTWNRGHYWRRAGHCFIYEAHESF